MVSINEGTQQWLVYKGKCQSKIDDLGVPLFQEITIFVSLLNTRSQANASILLSRFTNQHHPILWCSVRHNRIPKTSQFLQWTWFLIDHRVRIVSIRTITKDLDRIGSIICIYIYICIIHSAHQKSALTLKSSLICWSTLMGNKWKPMVSPWFSGKITTAAACHWAIRMGNLASAEKMGCEFSSNVKNRTTGTKMVGSC